MTHHRRGSHPNLAACKIPLSATETVADAPTCPDCRYIAREHPGILWTPAQWDEAIAKVGGIIGRHGGAT